MMPLKLKSEPVSPTGSISSTGIINQLGRPNLDTLAVLIRETVQNSWDARISDDNPISFTVNGWSLTPSQKQKLSSYVFAEIPARESLALAKLFSNEPLHGLIIADRGTVGLAGPTRADVVPKDVPRNFISFLRDIGQPAKQDLSGGTYGYGKASLYRASGIQTILVHTRCRLENGKLESRFIASGLGERWADSKGRQYTGRHWWGIDGGDVAEPVLDNDADLLARALGMGSFEEDETGTTILILDPLFNDHQHEEQQGPSVNGKRTPQQALNLMAEYILWFFWPKMLNTLGDQPAVHFHLLWENTPVPLHNPTYYPPLSGFVEAMERLKGRITEEPVLKSSIKDIASSKPRQHLGKLALQQFLIEDIGRFDTGETDSPFTSITHHTALMRQAELVVKYLEGAPVPNSKVGYAGVFITDEEVDSVFASAEPPTHDDWNSKSLTDNWHKRYINVALRKIGEEMSEFVQTPTIGAAAGSLTPLGAFATWLGESLIPAEVGSAATRPKQRPNAVLPSFPVLSDTAAGTPTFSGQVGSASGGNNILAVPEAWKSGDQLPSSDTSDGDGEYITPHQPPSAPAVPVYVAPLNGDQPPKRKQIIGRSSAEIISDMLLDYDGSAALLITFAVRHAKNADGSTIAVNVQAVLDGDSIESEPPLGAGTAQVVRWISPENQVFSDADSSIYIAADQPAEPWKVLVLLPDDMMANIDLAAQAELVS